MTRKRSVRSGFDQRFLAKLRQCRVRPGERRVVGFSGGPDSLALAFALRHVAPMLELNPLLVHVDHGLRPTSKSDARRCVEIAREIGAPIESVTLAPGLTERSAGLGVEEQARRERYLALATAAKAWGAASIVLGHQADDQAETVLLHLIRGTGSRGLGGMRPVDTRNIPWWNESETPVGTFRIVRPLLDERRAEIEAYLDELGQAPLIDESNLGDTFDRNWMRLRVLPQILERWPGAIESIARSAEVIRLESETAESGSLAPENPDHLGIRTLRTDDLLEADRPEAFRLIRTWLSALGIDRPGFDVVARIYNFIRTSPATKSIEIGSREHAVIDSDRLMTLGDLLDRSIDSLPLLVEGHRAKWKIQIVEISGAADGAVQITSEETPRVRTIRAGDRWAGTTRKVMDDLRTAGIHPLVRRHVLVVASDEGVLLIPAIYPTIHSKNTGEGVRRRWVRWQKV